MDSRIVVALLVVLVLTLPAMAAPEYQISVENSVETPPRTVTLQNQTHSVANVARVDPKTVLSVQVSVPHDERYRVQLYNTDRYIEASTSKTGDGTVTFDAPPEPGSYMLTIKYDGYHQVLYPVVVQQYIINLDAPSEATVNDNIQLSATVPGNDQPERVEFIVADDDQTVRETATRGADGSYETTTALSSLDEGEYAVYAAVEGDAVAFDANDATELLALSDTVTLTIKGESADGQSSNAGAQQSTETTTETATITTTTTPAKSSTTTTSDVITPVAATSEQPATTTSTGQSGFSVVLAALALTVATIARRRLQ